MTVEISDTNDRLVISGTGPYVFGFRIFNEADLAVSVDTGALDTVPLVLSADYTVAGVDDEDGGTVTLSAGTAAAYAGKTLDMRSNTTQTQPTSIRNQGAFLPEIHEDALDRLARQIQDLNRVVRACFRYPDDTSLDAVMATRTGWADRYLYVNTAGEIEPASLIGGITSVTQSLVVSLLNSDVPSAQEDLAILLGKGRTAAETAAGVTIADYSIPSHETCGYVIVERYTTNTTPGTTNMATAINTAISLAKSSRCGKVTSVSSILGIGSTVDLQSYVKVDFSYGETNEGGGTAESGTKLVWTGANGGTMVNMVNVRMAEFCGFVLDGNTKTGVRSFLLDSTNNPSGSQNTIHHFSIRNCLLGVQWGTSGIAGGSYANDGTEFHTFTIWSSEAGSRGYAINSGNAGQMSVIRNGGIQTMDVGIDIQVANILKISQVFGGGTMDTAFIRTSVGIDLTIEGCSSECWGTGKTWRTNRPKFLKVIAPGESYPVIEGCISMSGNQINNPIELGYPVRISSDGDSWGYCKDYTTSIDEGAKGNAIAGPAWSGATAYVIGNVVSSGGLNYYCILGHTNQVPPNATYWSANRGKSRVTSTNNGVNPGSTDLMTSEPIHGWIDSVYVHLSNLEPGRDWVRPAFSAGAYTTNGAGGWTLTSGDVEYYGYVLFNRAMTVSFSLVTTSVIAAVGTELRVAIPNGRIATQPMRNPVYISDNGTAEIGLASVDAGSTYITIKRLAAGNFTASANNTQVKGQLTFMVD
jgi:hypothetical protein